MWEPVTDGAAYIAELERLSRAFAGAQAAAKWPLEALDVRGFPLTLKLADSLQRLSVTHDPPRARRVLFLESHASGRADALRSAVPGLRHEVRAGLEDWGRILEDGNVLLPHASVTCIREFLLDD